MVKNLVKQKQDTKALELSKDEKPYYIATYDNSYGDSSMSERINKHIIERMMILLLLKTKRFDKSSKRDQNIHLIDCLYVAFKQSRQKRV